MIGLPDPLLSQAVLIGVSSYQKLNDIPAVHANLATIREVLCDRRFWGLPRENCVVVDSPETAARMLDPVADAAENATDTLLLYYAGHGLVDRRSDLHLSLVGSDPLRMYTSVPYGQIRDLLLDSRASRRIVMLDCCYSGRALGQMANPVSTVVDEAGAEGTYVLAAAAENKVALARPGDRYTAFTGELLDIIHKGISECGPFLDLDSIYRHLRVAMKSKGFPVPQKRDRNTAGQLTLIRNQAFADRLQRKHEEVLARTITGVTSPWLEYPAANVTAESAGSRLVKVTLGGLGESVLEATVTHWLKKLGEYVDADESLLEVSTGGAYFEIPSPVHGILRRIDVPQDQTAQVGCVLAVIEPKSMHGVFNGPRRAPGPTAGQNAPIPAGFGLRRPQRLQYSAPPVDGGMHVETSRGPAVWDEFSRVGRNDLCPCGSGRKFKRCHGDPRTRVGDTGPEGADVSARLTQFRELPEQVPRLDSSVGRLEGQARAPEFTIVMRGYNPRQVDEYVAHLIINPSLPMPDFETVMRGYSREEVQRYIRSIARPT